MNRFTAQIYPFGISLKQLHKAATVGPLYRRNTNSQSQKHTHTHTRISSLGCSERYINLSNKQLNHLPLSMQCGCLLAITDADGRKDEDLGPKARMSNGWLTGWPELEPNLSPKEDDRQMGKLE